MGIHLDIHCCAQGLISKGHIHVHAAIQMKGLQVVSLLDRLQLVFLEAGLSHVNQSAYWKRVSCADAIFATQEVIARCLQGGDNVFMCLYDLQKVFDSLEYAVLLNKLFEVGVNGKMWRLLGGLVYWCYLSSET